MFLKPGGKGNHPFPIISVSLSGKGNIDTIQAKATSIIAEREREEQAAISRMRAPVSPGAVGRNDPCPCGSMRKFKHCCGKHAARG